MDTLDGAQTFHLAEKIESVMQMMQVCLLNTGNVCGNRNALGECDCKHLQLDTPATWSKPTDG